MQFRQFAEYLQKLEATPSRLAITAILAEVFQGLDKVEVQEACYLLQGQVLPQYLSIELQIAVKTVTKAIARLIPSNQKTSEGLFEETDFTEQEKDVEHEYHQLGDLGLVVEKVLREYPQTHQQKNIQGVYAALLALAHDTGAQSQQRKLDALVELLKNLDPISAKFVTRIILGRLRLGFSDMTMIDALSWAMTGSKSEHDMLEDAYQKKTDIGKLAAFYLQEKDPEKRQAALANYKVEVGVPVIPALCQRLNSAAEMIEKMHEVIAEPKYDGLRVQIHMNKNAADPNQKLKTFTRNLEDSTQMFPELLEALSSLKCHTCILDAEAIGFDPTTGDLLPFQQTMQRKRKHGIQEKSKEIPVRFYVFDVLAIDDEDLLQVPLRERKAKLQKLFRDDHILYHAPELRTTDPIELHTYHEAQLAEGLEGVVVKQIDSVYQSGRKGWSWVKMKEAEGNSGKLSDTIDVVVMGYYLGRGKRTSFGIGAFLVGVLDEKQGKILTIAKIGTGLTDDTLRETKKRCQKLETKQKPAEYEVHKMLVPDVWCLPGFVVEVAADEVTVSPIHSAGMALRFPRLAKFRDDKTWQQITTLDELKQIAGAVDGPAA